MPRTDVHPRGGRGLGGERVEGRRAVLECFRAGRRRVRRVIVEAGREPEAIIEAAARAGVPVELLPPERFERVARTEVHQGVLADCDPVVDVGLDGLADGSLLVVVDHLEDPHNLGAVLRSAAAFGADGVVLPRYRSVPLTPTVTKVAAGGVEWLRFALVSSIPAALRRLRARGVWSVGLDADAATSVFSLTLATERLALVVGAEGRGLAPLVRRGVDVTAAIPLAATVASLNASVAASIALAAIVDARTRA
ncbi:RNA methyltransferase, TrmH family, group 3 [Acidimicrobium ferrooxidans DSM 10331]|uniref:RNA methyltransferase, TrmH family, group 3 n=1 Tax=Acidimicrobium ferrooxidans (strain DSM 10331 / JCM 15462 / NBRC 103882 / ICP) TaxID=525909 RepID=C7M1Q7_ACIFD|nr:23S rRNA (guanosine(2251)-2'-O)-methyltransferase RlmB [Acidimicrobium ferrooxidans]ACU54804.1 RNA methyltransferase, TrmH family, group 3 [Acidimicrobium ferrooxidans DSM 10331]